MSTYDKPFKNIDEQIEILKSRNLIIDNFREAREILSNFSYHTLINKYSKKLCDESGNFFAGTSLQNLKYLCLIDMQLNIILLKHILYIEKSFKTKLAYLIAENFGVYTDYSTIGCTTLTNKSDYLCSFNYSNNRGDRKNILLKIKDEIKLARSSSAIHFYKSNKNHIPPWILIDDISFSKSIRWFKILKPSHKFSISSKMLGSSNSLTKPNQINELFTSCLSVTNDFRNAIAHGNKIESFVINNNIQDTILNSFFGSTIVSKSDYNNGIGKNDIYAVILSLCLLTNDKVLYSQFLKEISTFMEFVAKTDIANKTIYELLNIPIDILDKLNLVYDLKNTKAGNN